MAIICPADPSRPKSVFRICKFSSVVMHRQRSILCSILAHTLEQQPSDKQGYPRIVQMRTPRSLLESSYFIPLFEKHDSASVHQEGCHRKYLQGSKAGKITKFKPINDNIRGPRTVHKRKTLEDSCKLHTMIVSPSRLQKLEGNYLQQLILLKKSSISMISWQYQCHRFYFEDIFLLTGPRRFFSLNQISTVGVVPRIKWACFVLSILESYSKALPTVKSQPDQSPIGRLTQQLNQLNQIELDFGVFIHSSLVG
ncbi:hypothetical protein F5051DRAFT_503515 [Lentinula edodes]|nr:hypothetical protein F5051DRAFT_503515 [Lentinula edodes]